MSRRIRDWVGRHRLLVGFLGGVLLTGAAVAVVGWVILADQRRAAALMSAALSRTFAREVQIDRVIDLSLGRVGLAGVRLPAAGGWPADIAADRIEASGPLGAAARGDAAPVRVVVSGARVTTTSGTTTGFTGLGALPATIRSFLAQGPPVDLALAGGALQVGAGTPPLSFDLVFRKDRSQARAEITVRAAGAKAFVLAADLVASGLEARLSASGQGSADVFAAWLPPAGRPAVAGRSLDLRADARVDAADGLEGRARVGLGESTFVQGAARIRGGVVELSQGAVSLDLTLGAALAGLAGLTGQVVLSELAGRWEPDRGGRPTLTAVLSAPQVTIPASLAGSEAVADGVAGRIALGPAPAGSAPGDLGASGTLTVTRFRSAGMEARPIETRFRATLQPSGRPRLVELEGLAAAVAGARVDGALAWDAERGRATGRLSGKAVELAGLVRVWAPGWLAAGDRLAASGLDVQFADVDPKTLGSGTADVALGRVTWGRSTGEIGAGPVAGRLRLADGGGTVTLNVAALGGSLAGKTGQAMRVTVEADLARSAGGGMGPRRIQLRARDRTGAALADALLEPGPPGGPGGFRITARLPALDRLEDLWPEGVGKLTGTATLEAVLRDGLSAANLDGRLRVDVPEAALSGDKILVRQIAVDLPVRRGLEAAGPPAWGKVEVGELIGFGVVVHDLVTPARLWHDRLALNDLAYALYSGTGKGWAEAEWGSGGVTARGQLTGSGVRVEEFIGAYGIRGGTMTGVLRYELDGRFQGGRLGVNGRFEIPEGGRVSIELLDRLFGYAATDPTGVVRSALENLRAFDYKAATIAVNTASDEIRVNLSLKGRERFLIFPPKVREINVQGMPLSFLAGQFPGY